MWKNCVPSNLQTTYILPVLRFRALLTEGGAKQLELVRG
jgi:hypothetical protein